MYLKIIDIMNKYQISRTSVNTMIAEMQDCKSGKHLKKRYPASAVIGIKRMRRIDSDCFQDYFENLERLRHPNMRKYVEDFRDGKKSA